MAHNGQNHDSNDSPRQLSVAIIGAGFSGLCMGIKLREARESSFVIFEAAEEVGGTWRENTYPGCTCDIASPLYSFSFAQSTSWSALHAPQPEIWAYQKSLVQRYGLTPHLKYSTRITAAAWDEEAAVWRLTTAAGEECAARVLVLAVGAQSVPSIPDVPGLASFKGAAFHSAKWDHKYDLRGKRVAVIGTGASAVQVIPAIQPLVGKLYVFQRSPGWVVPRDDVLFSPQQRSSWWWPLWMRLKRLRLFLWQELIPGRAIVSNNKRVLNQVEALSLDHLRKQVPDEELRNKLVPDFTFGCKRVLVSDDYYPALTQPNVQLIASGLAKVKDGTTLVAQDGTEAEVDAVIFTTGFNIEASTKKVDIRGRDGITLKEAWSAENGGPSGYYGMAVAGFPNMFQLMVGPNTGLGHNSIIYMAECQVGYLMRMLGWMRSAHLSWVEVKASVQAAFHREMQERLKSSVWLSGCTSWYLGSTGRGVVPWPGICMEYWWRTLWVRKEDYDTGLSASS